MNNNGCHHIIIDWGTTNFRAFAMSKEHELLDSITLAIGLLNIEKDDFSSTLKQVLENLIGKHYKQLPVFMAGMVGSSQGWVNVDYVSTPVSLRELVSGCHRFILPWGAKAYIYPGVSHQYSNSKFDVMRGEEVQAFGFSHLINCDSALIILPGTHSKHISLNHNKIDAVTSYLTGELFSLLLGHSILGRGLPDSQIMYQKAFIRGVREAQQGEFSQRIFLARTHLLFEQLLAEEVSDYLSGMLIGFELRNIDKHHKIHLVGADDLCEKYQLAATEMGHNVEIINGNQSFIAGMSELIKANKD